jgi:hypothetical protein
MSADTLLRDFATTHGLRVTRDELRDRFIPGRFGQLYQYSADRLAVQIMAPGQARLYMGRRRACLAVGMTSRQHGDDEGTLLFDPADGAQATAAIEAVQARRRRVLSAEQRAACVSRLAAHRFPPARQGTITGVFPGVDGAGAPAPTSDASGATDAAPALQGRPLRAPPDQAAA